MFVDIHIHCFRLLLTFYEINEGNATIRLSYYERIELFPIYFGILCVTS